MSCQTIYLAVPLPHILEAKTDWRYAEKLSRVDSFSYQGQTVEGVICPQRWGECLGFLWFLSLLDSQPVDEAKRLALLACRGGHWLSKRWDKFPYSIPFYTLPEEVAEVAKSMSTLDWSKVEEKLSTLRWNQADFRSLSTAFQNIPGILQPPTERVRFEYFVETCQRAVRIGSSWQQLYENAYDSNWGLVVSFG